MPKIKLDAPWTYRTIEKTIDYPAGEHEVFQYIADQAEADGVIKQEADNGQGSAADSAPRRARKAKD